MLDAANQDFVNGAVTVVRYGVYFVIGMLLIMAAWKLLAWLWKLIRPTTAKSEFEHAKQKMRDLGY